MNKIKGNSKGEIFDYDALNDSLFLHTPGVGYKSSIDFGDIVLDLAEDNSITGLEILRASDVFGISKYDIGNIKGVEAEMTVSSGSIDLKIRVHISKRNANILRVAVTSGDNYMNLPPGSESMAVSA